MQIRGHRGPLEKGRHVAAPQRVPAQDIGELQGAARDPAQGERRRRLGSPPQLAHRITRLTAHSRALQPRNPQRELTAQILLRHRHRHQPGRLVHSRIRPVPRHRDPGPPSPSMLTPSALIEPAASCWFLEHFWCRVSGLLRRLRGPRRDPAAVGDPRTRWRPPIPAPRQRRRVGRHDGLRRRRCRGGGWGSSAGRDSGREGRLDGVGGLLAQVDLLADPVVREGERAVGLGPVEVIGQRHDGLHLLLPDRRLSASP